MFASFRCWLASLFGATPRDAGSEAQKRREKAYARLRQARERGDDRAYGHALMELRQATHDLLAEQVYR